MNKKALAQFIIVTMAVVILSLLYFFYPAADSNFYPKCIFYSITGFDCPGCGSQRAASALLHGRIMDALDYNILFVLLIPLVFYSAFVFSWNAFSRKKITQNIFYSPVFVKTILFLALVFWVSRNIPVSPFNWLKA
jgi:hypothetical protein